jgi:Ca-activated chloride channel family protein
MAGTLFAIAKDVKLQVEFDSTTVQTYRLIGYENRLLAKEDFEDDTKDAGELGAGHTVTALYEIVPQPGAESEPLGTLHLRYKEPAESQSRYLKHELPGDAQLLEQTSENFRFAAAVATYAHCLRGSKHKGLATLSLARELADQARQDDLENYRADFVELVKQTENLTAQLAKAGQK